MLNIWNSVKTIERRQFRKNQTSSSGKEYVPINFMYILEPFEKFRDVKYDSELSSSFNFKP